MSGNGWCTHPDRQVSSDVRILVRKAELACRNAWGSDLWVDANADESATPQPPRQPQPEQPMPVINVSYDDEITSVVNTGEHTSASLDDEVVEQSTISFDDDYDEEQDERRDLLYRDSRSAIERARQRHMQRRQQPVGSDEDTVISQEAEPAPADVRSREQPVFEPDDFVEDETPRPSSTYAEEDDALLSEGVQTPTPRSLRLRRFRDEQRIPKKDLTATKIDPEPDVVDLELPPSGAPERGRFDSIPEISADFDLPLLRRSSSANKHEELPIQEPTSSSMSYERALKRAHDIHAAARLERNQEQRRSDAPPPLRHPARGLMPDLPDISSGESGVSEQLRAIADQGTSAILHPRATIDIAREQQNQPRMRPQPSGELQLPAQGERMRTRQPEVRRSWWRGTRQPDVVDSAEPAWPVSGASKEWSSESALTPAVSAPEPQVSPYEAPAELNQAPASATLDLHDDEEMDSFRDRLFASAPVQEETVTRSRRTPISVARRQTRPVSQGPQPRQQPDVSERETVQVTANKRPAPVQPEVEPEIQAAPRRPALPDVEVPVRRQGAPTARAAARPVQDERGPARQARRALVPEQSHRETIRPEMLLDDPEDAWYEPEPVRGFDVRNFIEEDSGLLDMTIKIAPRVPRACATCRSYRPWEEEGRGWCTNEWAFTHRQMVNEADLACNSTIGCWWLPTDKATWLDEFEVAADATPRVDRLIAHLNPEHRAVNN